MKNLGKIYLTLAITCFFNVSHIFAQENNSQVSQFKPPDLAEDSPKGRKRGTASRGECSFDVSQQTRTINIIPLIPLDSRGLTVSKSPVVWFYLSYNGEVSDTNLSGEFSLEEPKKIEEGLEGNSRFPVSLPPTSGFFSVSVPYELQVNNWYRWYLTINCNDNNNNVISFEGLINRSEIEQNLDNLTSFEKIDIYNNQGIWYDSLNETASLNCQNPNAPQAREIWLSLLEFIELNQYSESPLICPK
jgi:hypothetical protein